MLARRQIILLAFSCLLVRAGAAHAPEVVADVIYHEHYRGNYDPGEEDTALRANGTALSYLRLLAARFSNYVAPGGEGSFTYLKTGPATAQLAITDNAGTLVTRTLTFLTDTEGTWLSALYPGGERIEQTFSLRPLHPALPLLNSSSRTTVGPTQRSIFGFVVAGQPRQVLVRVVGPGLQAFGVTAVASAPVLELFSAAGVRYVINSGWDKDRERLPLEPIFRLVGAFPLAPGSSDAACMLTLSPGSYTVQASSAGTVGEVLTEIYVLP